MLSPGKAHPESHNYISLFDAVPKQVLEGELATEIFGGSKRGLAPLETLDQMIQEKLNRLLDTNDINVWAVERAKYLAKYMPIFPLLVNVTVLDEKKKKNPLEHCIDAPCYKNKLEEIIKKYMGAAEPREEKTSSELVLST